MVRFHSVTCNTLVTTPITQKLYGLGFTGLGCARPRAQHPRDIRTPQILLIHNQGSHWGLRLSSRNGPLRIDFLQPRVEPAVQLPGFARFLFGEVVLLGGVAPKIVEFFPVEFVKPD